MTLRWIEGFDAVTHIDGLGRLYDASLPVSFILEDGANVPTDEALSSDENSITSVALVGSPTNTWIIGFAFRSDDTFEINGGAIPFVSLGNSAGEQIRVEFLDFVPSSTKPGGVYYKLRIMRGAVEIATSNEAFALGISNNEEWIFFEFKITIDNASGSVEGRYHWIRHQARNPGGAYTTLTWDASVTSIDTQEQASTGADRFTISWDTGNTADPVAFDDMYLCDNLGSKNNDFLGKIIIQQQTITTSGGGDGDTTEWDIVTATTTEDALQSLHGSLEDDKRITSDSVAEIHLAAQNVLPTESSNSKIIGVRKDVHGRMETSGSLSIGHMWRKTTGTPAQTEHGTALVVSSTTTEANAVVAEDDPNTGTDWVNLDLDSYQFGVKNNG